MTATDIVCWPAAVHRRRRRPALNPPRLCMGRWLPVRDVPGGRLAPEAAREHAQVLTRSSTTSTSVSLLHVEAVGAGDVLSRGRPRADWSVSSSTCRIDEVCCTKPHALAPIQTTYRCLNGAKPHALAQHKLSMSCKSVIHGRAPYTQVRQSAEPNVSKQGGHTPNRPT